jgi:hypothetical protein
MNRPQRPILPLLLSRQRLRAADRATDRAADRATDQATDQAADRATDQAADRATDQAADRATDQAVAQPTDQAVARAADRVADRATDWGTRTVTPGSPMVIEPCAVRLLAVAVEALAVRRGQEEPSTVALEQSPRLPPLARLQDHPACSAEMAPRQ